MPISKKVRLDLAQRLLQSGLLNERETNILKMRLGLDGLKPATLQEIGTKYDITRERVRQIGAAIVRKIKKNMPDEKAFAGKFFGKAWEPKYFVKERYLIRRRAVIKRNKSLVRKKAKKLAGYIDEYAVTKLGKEKINALFKELRIKYRKNKSLFEDDVVAEIKNLRVRWKEVRKVKPQVQQENQTPPIPPQPPILPIDPTGTNPVL